jgi:hypothetical protein
MKLVAFFLLIASGMVYAQSTQTSFPDGSEILSQDNLKESLSDKVFAVNVSQGPAWRWEFKSNGYHYLNVGNFNDSGKWSTKGSTVCTEGRRIEASCNEVRVQAKELYLKRDNGEVVKLVVK